MASRSAPTINLLAKPKPSFADQFFSWALGAGRFIIILTETIALATFLYRFGLDRQIIDLHDTIKRDEAVVSELGKNEATYRNLQTRLATIKTLTQTSSTSATELHAIVDMARGNLVFDELDITSDSIKMDARVTSTKGLRTFVQKLQSYPAVSSVSIDDVENKTSVATISVTITATLKSAQASPGTVDTTNATPID